jgi:hypothetical protein
MTDVSPPTLSPSRWSGHLTDLRDAGLVIGALIYAFGYVTWAVYAYAWDLGPMPALDSQYFVAGVVPFLCTVGLATAAWFINRTARPWLIQQTRARRAALTLPPMLIGLALIMSSASATTSTLVGMLLVMITIFASDTTALSPFKNSTSPGTACLLGCGVMFAALYAMPLGGFSQIPQELGGGAPRCAYIEVDRTQIGSAVQRELLRLDAKRLQEPQRRVAQDLRYPTMTR